MGSTIKWLLNLLAELKLCLANGQGYVGDLKYPIFLAITLKLYLPELSMLSTILITLLLVVLMIVIGFVDLNYVKLHQRIAQKGTEKYNPYFMKLKKRFK